MAINVRVVKITKSQLQQNPAFILTVLDGMKAGLSNIHDPEYCIYLTINSNVSDSEAEAGAKTNEALIPFTNNIYGYNVFSKKGNPPTDDEL